MAESNHSTITVNDAQKGTVVDLQDHFEEELGTRPTQGEAVAIAAEQVMEGDA